MKIRNRRRWAILCIVLVHCVAAGVETLYVEPDFSARIINLDAVSLEGEDRAEVVSALATLAGAEGIENLLRMKAIAIALRLDSMHPAARSINDQLIAGGPMVPGGDGAESLNGAVALLRETAQRLRDEKREEEDAVLYPYLVDIAAGTSEERPQPEGASLQGELHWELVLGSSGRSPEREVPAVSEIGAEKTSATGDGEIVSTGITDGGMVSREMGKGKGKGRGAGKFERTDAAPK